MFCGNCGNQIPDDSVFCGECGAATGVTAPVAEPAAPQPVFCGNCGSQMAADEVFCGVCGTRVGAPAPAQPVYNAAPVAAPAQPTWNPTPAAAPAKSGGLNIKLNENGFFKKDAYFLNRADSKSRMTYFISWGLVFVCLLTVWLSGLIAINGELFNRPVMNVLNLASGGDMKAGRAAFSDVVDEIEDIAELYDVEDEKAMKALSKLSNKFSLKNLHKAMKVYEDILEEIDDDYEVREVQTTRSLLGGLIAWIVICFMIVAILTVLSALFKNFPLAIVAIALNIGFAAVFTGFLWVLLSMAAYAGLIVVYIKMGKEYKTYAKAIA